MTTRHRIPTLMGGTAVAALITAGAHGAPAAAEPHTAATDMFPTVAPLQQDDQEPVLTSGDVGPAVTAWQEAVNAWIEQEAPLRGTIAVDGIFGPETEQATIDVQQNLDGVEADGTVDRETRLVLAANLLEGPTPPDPGEKSPPDDEPSAPGQEPDVDLSPFPPGEGPVLGAGSAGQPVEVWQQQINAWRDEVGLDPIAEDGIYGPVTENATRQFQEAQTITVDGLVGPSTRTEMQATLSGDAEEPSPPSEPPVDPDPPAEDERLLTTGVVGDDVAAWQETMNEWRADLGITPIAVDGIYGPVTADATRQFQAATGSLAVDGIVGPQTRAVAAQALRTDPTG